MTKHDPSGGGRVGHPSALGRSIVASAGLVAGLIARGVRRLVLDPRGGARSVLRKGRRLAYLLRTQPSQIGPALRRALVGRAVRPPPPRRDSPKARVRAELVALMTREVAAHRSQGS